MRDHFERPPNPSQKCSCVVHSTWNAFEAAKDIPLTNGARKRLSSVAPVAIVCDSNCRLVRKVQAGVNCWDDTTVDRWASVRSNREDPTRLELVDVRSLFLRPDRGGFGAPHR